MLSPKQLVSVGLLFVALLLSGCAGTPEVKPFEPSAPIVTAPVSSTPVVSAPVVTAPPAIQLVEPLRWASHGNGHADWTTFVVNKVAGSKLAKLNPKSDIKCKLDSDAERIEFWSQLVSVITLRESEFNPATNFKEDFNDANGNAVISRGLMQLSQESANQSAYKCGITKAIQLNDPFINLNCGVNIIEWWTKDPTTLGDDTKHYGCGRYWSVCRKYSDGKLKSSYKVIKGHVEGLAVCR